MAILQDDVSSMLRSRFNTFSDEITLGPDSPIQNYTKNITARTMLSELITISDEALKSALGGEEDNNPDNGCTYQYKSGENIVTIQVRVQSPSQSLSPCQESKSKV